LTVDKSKLTDILIIIMNIESELFNICII